MRAGKEITVKCDMCHKTLICVEHHKPIKFSESEIKRIRKTHFIHCEKCFQIKKRLFENLLKNLEEIKSNPDVPLLSLETHVNLAVAQVEKELPNLKPGECLNHCAKLFPKEIVGLSE